MNSAEMKIDVVTIFPEPIEKFFSYGIFKRAEGRSVTMRAHDLRTWATDKHKTVDDRPFGGGPGMVMKVEPMYNAVEELKSKESYVLLTSPRGEKLSSKIAKELAEKQHLIFLCGHYEGVDERVRDNIVDMDISIGDYVLSGGELPVLVVIDALLRHVPGVLGNPDSLVEESFESGLKTEYPQYTRPERFNGWDVPDLLLSGDHEKVRQWREDQARKK